MSETQQTICDWADITFGETDFSTALDRAIEEMEEFQDETNPEKLGKEAADIVITLYRVCQLLGVDLLEQVDLKMQINRARKWKITGKGVGQHE